MHSSFQSQNIYTFTETAVYPNSEMPGDCSNTCQHWGDLSAVCKALQSTAMFSMTDLAFGTQHMSPTELRSVPLSFAYCLTRIPYAG